MGICRFKNYSGVRKIIIIVAPDKYFYNKKWHGSYSLDWAQYNVAMVIIWIEIYRFLSPFVRDGEERIGETSRSRFPRKWIFSSSSDWNCFGPRIGGNCGPWDEGCTGSIPGDGCSSFSVGWSVWGGSLVFRVTLRRNCLQTRLHWALMSPSYIKKGGTGWECEVVSSGQGHWPRDIDSRRHGLWIQDVGSKFC